MATRKWDEKTYRATWEDVENWVQALYEDFHLRCRVQVHVAVPADKVDSAVMVEVFRVGARQHTDELWSDWRRLELRAPHHAEHLAIELLSRAWLDLDLGKRQAERQATLL